MDISDKNVSGNDAAKKEEPKGTDNDFAEKSFENIGAWIMGRNMFGPIRGPWPDDEWEGWWGRKTTLSCSGICFDAP